MGRCCPAHPAELCATTFQQLRLVFVFHRDLVHSQLLKLKRPLGCRFREEAQQANIGVMPSAEVASHPTPKKKCLVGGKTAKTNDLSGSQVLFAQEKQLVFGPQAGQQTRHRGLQGGRIRQLQSNLFVSKNGQVWSGPELLEPLSRHAQDLITKRVLRQVQQRKRI